LASRALSLVTLALRARAQGRDLDAFGVDQNGAKELVEGA